MNLGVTTYNIISIAFVACLLIRKVRGLVLNPKEVVGFAGQDVRIKFNTTNNNPISGFKVGLEAGKKYPVPKFLTVLYINGVIKIEDEVEDEKDPVAKAYKGRVIFDGDLAKGHAWFTVKCLVVSDTNRYNVNIREKSARDYKKFTFKLNVTEAETTMHKVWSLITEMPTTVSSILTAIRTSVLNSTVQPKINQTISEESNEYHIFKYVSFASLGLVVLLLLGYIVICYKWFPDRFRQHIDWCRRVWNNIKGFFLT